MIEITKGKISAPDLTIREIAYELGFEHCSSFNKLFKIKTQMLPLEFRRSFN
ncbi:MAG: AraC family transcriptional regulator [Chryseobacterium sp.]|nr:AraC family transcriptional regulator [Chryseobacterium sp.]